MWKKILALILIMCLIVGFTQDGKLYARTEENAIEETTEKAAEQSAQETEEDPVSEETKEVQTEEQPEEAQPEETQPEEKQPVEVQPEETPQPETPAEVPADAEEEPVQQSEKNSAAEENAEPEIAMETLSRLAARSANEYVNVKIYNNNVVTDGTIHTGLVSENVTQKEGDSHFVGAYVVLETGEEDEIAFIGISDGNVYYAFSEDSATGILLKEGQYIKLVYKTTCKITYEIKLEDGTICENGGTFYNKQESADYGTDVRVQFKASKGNAEVGDCTLISIKAIGADGTEKAIAVDEDGYGYLNNITQNVTICAQVSIINQYKLVVDKQTGGACVLGRTWRRNGLQYERSVQCFSK